MSNKKLYNRILEVKKQKDADKLFKKCIKHAIENGQDFYSAVYYEFHNIAAHAAKCHHKRFEKVMRLLTESELFEIDEDEVERIREERLEEN